MKKITLFLLTALFVVSTGLAQNGQQRVVQLPGTTKTVVKQAKVGSPKADMQRQRSAYAARSAREAFTNLHRKDGIPKAPWQMKAMRKAPLAEPITEQPEGRYEMYVRSGEAYGYSWMFGLIYSQVENGVAEVVFGDNNEVYIKNIISQYPTGVWIKGTLSGSTITFEVPQKLFEIEGDTYVIYVQKYDEKEQTYVLDKEVTSFTLDYDAATETISTPASSALATGENVISMTDADGVWAGYSDWNLSMVKLTEQPVEAPAGLETEQYSVVADGFSGTLAQVGFDGNDIYVQGIYPNMPDAWVKGTIDGDKVTFKNGQFMGADLVNNFYQYLVSGSVEEIYYEEWDYTYEEYMLSDEDIVFDYDAATKTLSNGSFFMVNAGMEVVKYAEIYKNAKIAPFTEVAATPATPEWDYIEEDMIGSFIYGEGWGYMVFNVPCADVDGNYILPEKLSYVLYTRVNGEESVYELTPDDYIYLEEEKMTEIPFEYTDSWDVEMMGNQRTVYYFVEGAEAWGVQAIYRGAGEERRSEIAWYDMMGLGSEIQPDAATPEYPDVAAGNEGNSLTYGFYTGQETIGTFGDYKPHTYDVAMKIQDETLVGTHIDEIIIPLQGVENMKDVKVWLSSQLRVENKENVPDLVSMNVTPTEDGFCTVKLDKPYTIPEEGVYVGYSLTIDEVVDDYTGAPVVVLNGAHEGGLYMHISSSVVKWIDMSSLLGYTAYIQVNVSGRSVKGDAASFAEGKDIFTAKDAPIEVKTSFVNHGGNGIQSLDVEYTLNGTTTPVHFDLADAEANAYGAVCTTTTTLPAISESGDYTLNVKILKVNDAENEDTDVESDFNVFVVDKMPKHRAFLEEFTGTWCGYCVRGYVGLEKLAELYPDDFVCVSYHNGDPMETVDYEEYPWNAFVLGEFPGFPGASVDRMAEIDAFWGFDYGVKPLGVADDLAARNEVFGHADLELLADYDVDNDAVNVTANVTFPFSPSENVYALEYILVADGLTGEAGTNWDQTNYYSGGEIAGEDCEELQPFIEAGSKVQGLVFNDVVVMKSQNYGEVGSIPETINASERITHTYTFDLAYALNTSGDPVIQDKEKLRVIVLLVNTETGEVFNANKVNVNNAETGIHSADSDLNNIRSIEYFDLSGRKVGRAQTGVNVMKITYNDGKTRSMKVIRK